MSLPCSWILTSGACSDDFWQCLPQINYPLFCIQHILFFPSTALPLSSLTTLLTWALFLPLPYWFCEVQWVEHGTSNVKGMGSILTKFQVFTGLSLWDNLSAGLPHWIYWCILLCNWCPSVSSVTASLIWQNAAVSFIPMWKRNAHTFYCLIEDVFFYSFFFF